jgi:hypothetical protein
MLKLGSTDGRSGILRGDGPGARSRAILEILIKVDRHNKTCRFALYCVTRIAIDPAKLSGSTRGSRLRGGTGGEECKK